jgi:mono/diheme cytochrome c family protein
VRTLLAAVLVLAACGTEPAGPEPGVTWSYPEVPAEAQRPGDPAKGYDYLVNGGYITCGIPKSIWDQVMTGGPGANAIPGRTGANAQLPYFYSVATSSEGIQVVSANCLTCHAGKINNKIIVGLGAHDRDFTTEPSGLADALLMYTSGVEKVETQRFADRLHAIAPYVKTQTIGVNPADNLTAALMAHRDPQTLAWSAEPLLELPPAIVAPVDVPPWWRMSKKHSMFYDAAGRGDHARIMMTASLLCSESVDEVTAIDQAFVDVRAWIETLEPPKYPFAIDAGLAARGRPIFNATCARCHGTYGEEGEYPNELVPLGDVGTDPLLAQGTAQFAAQYVDWFASSFWGQTSRLEPQSGYVAPPLDGIWATAPYFHNGSVPSIELVLDSTHRPTYWTRLYDVYDEAAVGWKWTPNDKGGDIHIYDTTQPGYGASGHDFGDQLTPDERKALLEYLKTL